MQDLHSTTYLPRAGALKPPVRRSRSQAEPWQPRADRPGGWLNPRGEAASTFGNTGKHRTGPDPGPDRAERRLNPQAPKGLVHKALIHYFFLCSSRSVSS